MGKRSALQQERIQSEREMDVFKRNDMIQKARFNLSVVEQRSVLYAISKIKPGDTHLKEYTFDIKDLYGVIGWKKESYTEFKAMLKKLRDRSWWILMQDGETESAVSWFSTVRSNKKTGKVTIKFHEDMMPYLIQLAEQNVFYTSYNLKYILPMSCQYSPRLYEILKSYKLNNLDWFFDVEKLKYLLDCQNYERFPDFRRFVLEPAVEEINKYTDLQIAYKCEKEGRRVARITFRMFAKTEKELFETQKTIQDKLDGQLDIFSIQEELSHDPLLKLTQERKKTILQEEYEESQKREKEQLRQLEIERSWRK